MTLPNLPRNDAARTSGRLPPDAESNPLQHAFRRRSDTRGHPLQAHFSSATPAESGATAGRDAAEDTCFRTGFVRLYVEHRGTLCRYAGRFVPSHDQAEDLVQDVFVRVWERRETIPDNAVPYLFRAVRNRAVDLLRHQQVVRDHRDESRREDDQSVEAGRFHAASHVALPPDRDMEYQEVLAALRSALQSLPPRQRQAYRLARICGFTYEEVAQIMGISMKTVESHLHRTYKAIRARCAAHRPH